MNRNEIIEKLSLFEPASLTALYAEANALKTSVIGSKVYLRGLVEFSNICSKNCYYCGIRCENKAVVRYELSDEEVIRAVEFAWKNRYGSVVLQSGEQQSAHFAKRITRLLHEIKIYTNNEVGITLSCGEQTSETYKEWFKAGAHRYLLRIETSNRKLYYKLHPNDEKHSFDTRLDAIRRLRAEGYQVGTGVMIGLPFQTIEHLADDLLFFQSMNVDMVGMGPYLEHSQTTLYQYRKFLLPPEKRLELALKMVATLRLLMPDINIAATTALQVLHPEGREMAVLAGANIIMPNMTLPEFRHNYLIYEHKPGVNDDAALSKSKLEENLQNAGITIGYGEWGDSQHFSHKSLDVRCQASYEL
ncbi:MAG: [FeFe] hydrogenase H-cluster radical SAM maturase HydE [Prevotellaceae bacterium]|jgi:biotin synthase|nr:[FeFe] hydrogenase H-cluster radical SAM maturase HydE [Prevotellaceae bacterium]